ncbi:hypothetical protein BUALT_Bualt16G0087800 [Buddleja alternifolia]|uniref:WRKY domain-containing protein n=1 Tax=Buddleja alternifolia TaxID=168488 RepID=A0AAV6WAA3_9LAMI|nr:hypothetical protein BUALT_Bualt16G0087800 [Buddleja alternifolia]
MEGADNRSSEAINGADNENSKPQKEGDEEIRDEKVEKYDEQSKNSNSDCAVDNTSRVESKVRQLETLASVQLPEDDSQSDFSESSHILSEVPVEFSLQPIQSVDEIKDQVKARHVEPPKAATGQSAQVQIQVPDDPSKLELSPSLAQSICSIPSSTLPEKKSQPVESGNNICLPEQDNQNTSGPKPLSTVPMLKTPSDGYNWRKYGQKQVKSPEGSRSYYRCTFSDCHAKKIECSDRFNRAIETVYRSQHNHDPPQKVNCTRETRPALQIVAVNGSNDTTHPERNVNDPVPSTPSKEPLLGIEQIPETKQQESSGSDETTETDIKEECADGSESRKRQVANYIEQKRNSTGEVGSLPKTGKKPKFVVHAAGDVGISGDGYRWRKYGQKMVKGNPHPRNYYRCTSAGCPVRKHIEKAVDNTSAVVITYKGVHDHDTPVPRKRDGPKSVATSPVSLDNLQIDKTEQHKSQTQWSVDKEGELTGQALSTGGEKSSESTRTLLSIGFEIKPC